MIFAQQGDPRAILISVALIGALLVGAHAETLRVPRPQR
jgi:hypothetical protein